MSNRVDNDEREHAADDGNNAAGPDSKQKSGNCRKEIAVRPGYLTVKEALREQGTDDSRQYEFKPFL